jgi:hypothetical protein
MLLLNFCLSMELRGALGLGAPRRVLSAPRNPK